MNSLARDRRRALYSFLFLFAVNLSSSLICPSLSLYLVPFLLIALPFFLQRPLPMKFSFRDIFLGLGVSFTVLHPFSIIAMMTGRVFLLSSLAVLIRQLFLVAFPEETFFRGFLQESFGNNRKGLIATSILFAVAHIPISLIIGNWFALLTFFPSLVMGWLYMRTRNTLPSTIFHFLANIVFIGFGGMLSL